MNIYVDMDGTVIAPTSGVKSLEEWEQRVLVQARPLNLSLLRWLLKLVEAGHTLHLWTDRSPRLAAATFRNLGKWGKLFTTASFNGDGVAGKVQRMVPGFVIDDKPIYLSCGEHGGIQVVWKLRK